MQNSKEHKLRSSAAQECRAFPSHIPWHQVVPTLQIENADCVEEMKKCIQFWFCYWHPNQNKNVESSLWLHNISDVHKYEDLLIHDLFKQILIFTFFPLEGCVWEQFLLQESELSLTPRSPEAATVSARHPMWKQV